MPDFPALPARSLISISFSAAFTIIALAALAAFAVIALAALAIVALATLAVVAFSESSFASFASALRAVPRQVPVLEAIVALREATHRILLEVTRHALICEHRSLFLDIS